MSFETLEERLRRIDEALSSLRTENLPSSDDDRQPVRSRSRYDTEYVKLRRRQEAWRNAARRGRRDTSSDACPAEVTRARGSREFGHGAERVTTHRCSVCAATFDHENDLERHATMHDKKSYECRNCGRRFSLPFILKRHAWQCHRKAPVEADTSTACRFCSFEARTHHGLSKHLNVEHWSEYLASRCSKCGFEFTSKRQLDAHAAIKHRQVKYECVVCTFFASSWPSFLAHIKRHYFRDLFQCATCTETFYSKRALRKHVIKHLEEIELRRLWRKRVWSENGGAVKVVNELAANGNGDGTFSNGLPHDWHARKTRREAEADSKESLECAKCGRECANKRNLRDHLAKHDRVKSFSCKHCPHKSASGQQLRWHVFRYHNDSFKSHERVLKCVLCNFETVTRHLFLKHTRGHVITRTTPEQRRRTNVLRDHNYSQRPQSEAPAVITWKCALCDYKSAGELRLKRHMKTHASDSVRSDDDGGGVVVKKEPESETPRSLSPPNGCAAKETPVTDWSIENIRLDLDECGGSAEKEAGSGGESGTRSESNGCAGNESTERTGWSIEDIRLDDDREGSVEKRAGSVGGESETARSSESEGCAEKEATGKTAWSIENIRLDADDRGGSAETKAGTVGGESESNGCAKKAWSIDNIEDIRIDEPKRPRKLQFLRLLTKPGTFVVRTTGNVWT